MGDWVPQRDLVHAAGQVILLALVHRLSAGGLVVLVVVHLGRRVVLLRSEWLNPSHSETVVIRGNGKLVQIS